MSESLETVSSSDRAFSNLQSKKSSAFNFMLLVRIGEFLALAVGMIAIALSFLIPEQNNALVVGSSALIVLLLLSFIRVDPNFCFN